MAGRIYLLNGDSTLIAMGELPYDSESLLQKLLRITPTSSPGSRSMPRHQGAGCSLPCAGLPRRTRRAGRWSLDHLFLDQDAIPTLVEVNEAPTPASGGRSSGRCSTTPPTPLFTGRSRRSKPGSRARCREDGVDPNADLWGYLTEGQDGVRLLAAGEDEPPGGSGPPALHRRRDPARVAAGCGVPRRPDGPAEGLAIEVKQFVGENLKTLVPRVLGQTEAARQKKVVGRGVLCQWDEARFSTPSLSGGANRTLEPPGDSSFQGASSTVYGFGGDRARRTGRSSHVRQQLGEKPFFSVWTYGTVELQFQQLRLPPFSDAHESQELAHRLIRCRGVHPRDFPEQLSVQTQAAAGVHPGHFLETFHWVLTEIKKAETMIVLPHLPGTEEDEEPA